MIQTSADYKRQLIAGNRNYVIKVDVTLKGSLTTDFTLTNEDIWDNGITFDDAISSSSSFDLGAAIVGSLKVVIDNIHGNFSQYDFLDARLTLWMGVEGDLDNGAQRYYRKGYYVVDEPSYNGSLITLNCLDNMTWFDVPYSEVGLATNANKTAKQVVQAICSHVGVSLGTTSFPNYTTTIYKQSLVALTDLDLNCREVIQYIAQKCCCYAKMNTAGQLALNWFDKTAITGLVDWDGGTYNTTTTPYSDGCEVEGGFFHYGDHPDPVDGGTFEQLRDGAWLSNNFEMSVSTDDIMVTGVRIKADNVKNYSDSEEDLNYDVTWASSSVEANHDRYLLVIENNPLILKSEASTIAQTIGGILAGLPIRAFTARSLNDFSIEVGDMVTIVDFRGNNYYTWITGLTFTTNDSESFYCGAQSVKKRNETRFSSTLAEGKQYAKAQLSDYDRAVKEMDTLAQNAIGFNEYVYTSGSTKIMYRYDGAAFSPSGSNPKFPNANNVFKITGDGVFVARRSNGDIAADGTCTYSNGYDANSGTAILNLIYVEGLNAGWITAGTMTANYIRGGSLEIGGNANGTRKNGTLKIYNSSDVLVGQWTRGGITLYDGNGTATSNIIGTWSTSGIDIDKGDINLGGGDFHVTNAGAMTAKSGYIGNGTSGWTIGNTAIYNGISGVSDDSASGTYVGVAGIRNQYNTTSGGITTKKYVRIYQGGLNANSVNLTGTITATGGTIGGCSITNGSLSVPMANVTGNLAANRISAGTISSCTLSAGSISGSSKFNMTAQGSSEDTELDWGDTWDDSLTVVVNSNTEAGIGVCKKNNRFTKAVYMHYDDIRRYHDDPNPEYVEWDCPHSDMRLKENIEDIDSELLKKLFTKIRPIRFKYIDGQDNQVGLIAQEFIEVLKELGLDESQFVETDNRGFLMLKYNKLFRYSMLATHYLYEELDNQQEQIDDLKQELAELKARIK